MNKITAAQLWYVSRVYPERVTDEEAKRDFDIRVTKEADVAYWESAARVVSDLVNNRPAGCEHIQLEVVRRPS